MACIETPVLAYLDEVGLQADRGVHDQLEGSLRGGGRAYSGAEG